MSSYSSSDEEDNLECPLCMEEIDIADKYFKPCVCGYQICRFCWHHIKEDLNGLCPGCRREYTEEMVQFKPLSPEKLAQLKAKRKAKKREKKEQENIAKKHYANVRVIQKNLVYVIGLPAYVANEETIKQYDYFGQYGKITKVVINKKTHSPHQSTVGIYITYSKKEEAERAIEAVDNMIFDGRQVKASYGTTKYCTFYLRGQTCQNPQCMYLHEPGEEIESKEDLINKTQSISQTPPVPHVKEVKTSTQPKPIKTTIYREKDETSALPASANWGSRNSKTKLEDGEKKAISISLSDLISRSNENTKTHNINLLRSKSDSQSPLKTKTENKVKTISTSKSHSVISTVNTSLNANETSIESHSEKMTKSNSTRDEEYPALSSLLSKKNNHSKEGRSSSHSSLIMSPQSAHSNMNITIISNNSKEMINKEENENNIKFSNDVINSDDNNTEVNDLDEGKTEDIPKTESPVPEKDEINIKTEEKEAVDETPNKSILDEISKAYTVDNMSATISDVPSHPLNTVTASSSSYSIFSDISKSPSQTSKESKTKTTNSPPPGFENKMESRTATPYISSADGNLSDNINNTFAKMKITDDEIIKDQNNNHLNEFKYNGPFDPFSDIALNNLMNVNSIMNSYSKHYPQSFNNFNNIYNNSFNNMNQMNPLMNEAVFNQYHNQLNQKYLEQYYQNLNREQIQNNLRAMLPNINISPFSNANDLNPWSQFSQNNYNDNMFNNFNSLAAALNGNNNMFYNNNINNNMNILKQLQINQMLSNMQKAQQQQKMENNLPLTNSNLNLNNTSQDFKSLPFKDSAIMAVKMSNNNNNTIDNSNQLSNNMNSMNLFQNLNMKSNDIANHTMNPVSPMNTFANLNQLNQMNNLNGMAQLNSLNSLNGINNMNNLQNLSNMNNFNDISVMNMTSNSLTSPIIPSSSSMNSFPFKGMNGIEKEGLGGLTTSINSAYDDDKMKFFQEISELNKDERENSYSMNSLPDFWKSKIQDTGGGNENQDNFDLLSNSILEQRFNEAEQKSMEIFKNSEENQKNLINQTNTGIQDDDHIITKSKSEEVKEKEKEEKDFQEKLSENSTKSITPKNELLDLLIRRKTPLESKKLNEGSKKEFDNCLNSKENVESNHIKIVNDNVISVISNNSKVKNSKEIDSIQEKENINNNQNLVVSNKNLKPKKKEKKDQLNSKKETQKSTLKKEQKSDVKKELKSEPLIIKFEPKKPKKEHINNNEIKKEEPLLIEKSSKKEESMSLKVQDNITSEEKLDLNEDKQSNGMEGVKSNEDDKKNKQVNVLEKLPEVILNDNQSKNKDNVSKIDNVLENDVVEKTTKENVNKKQETVLTNMISPSSSGGTKKSKKKSKHKKKKASEKTKDSFEESIDLINKELDMQEKQANKTSKESTNEKKENETSNQSKKKKKSKKKNNDIELHILTVKDNKTQLMKETQLYRLPLTAIAKKLIPEDSGTTLGLKPIFPPDIEIEALCNVIVKRSKKKKRDNINLPFFKSKIGQLKSELEDDKIDFNYIDDVDENVIIEGSEEHANLMKQKQMEILKNHNMEVNMITSLKQIKRRNLNNITSNNINNSVINKINSSSINKNNVINEIEIVAENHSEDEDIIENLTDEFLDEEDIQEIKEGLGLEPDDIIELKMTNNIMEHQDFVDKLNEKMIDAHKTEESNNENQFFVLQALDALINTAEVYASALKKQIEEYEKKDCNEKEEENSINYNRKVKIYEAVLESIKDIREMGLSDYKTIEKLYFSDPKGEENYEDNINNLLISVKYIMQELVLNVDEPDILPQVLSLNKNTNILLSKMKGDKFKDTVLEHYKKLFKEKYGNLDSTFGRPTVSSQSNHGKNSILYSPKLEKNHKNHHETVLPPLPPPPTVDIETSTSTSDVVPEIIEPENLKMVNQNIKKFLKDYKMDESNKIIKIKKSNGEKPSSSNIELKIEYENEEVKNRVEKISKTENELYNSTEDILLELILKSQENQELKTKLISNCLNFDVNLAKKLANSLKMKGRETNEMKTKFNKESDSLPFENNGIEIELNVEHNNSLKTLRKGKDQKKI